MINKILILLIIIFLINHLTNGQILSTIQNYLFKCKGFIENNKVNNQQLSKIDNGYDLYRFINNLAKPNGQNSLPSQSERLIADSSLVNQIMVQLTGILNSQQFVFNNIKLLNDIHFYENYNGKEIESFSVSADVYRQNILIGSVIMTFDASLKKETNSLTITMVKLQSIKNKANPNEPQGAPGATNNQKEVGNFNPSKAEQQATQKTKELAGKMTESFNGLFVGRENYDDLFIKPSQPHVTENFINDTENSLIPSIINMTSYEETSETKSSA